MQIWIFLKIENMDCQPIPQPETASVMSLQESISLLTRILNLI